MFNKKLLSGILAVVLLFSTVAAATFSDVENDPTVAWAKPYITEMSEKGYIKGYEDGTFKPNNPISKTEALILLSRMIGVNND
ncbi:MAG: S-layer homology domain-containing protein, partial [Clostridia bacterium]|nr:S-layer homology domain-containing protein [Clostridia bacterium]